MEARPDASKTAWGDAPHGDLGRRFQEDQGRRFQEDRGRPAAWEADPRYVRVAELHPVCRRGPAIGHPPPHRADASPRRACTAKESQGTAMSRTIPLIELAGTPFEMGLAHGRAMKEAITDFVASIAEIGRAHV
mgnify:CR=1 FL=1